MTGLVRTSSEDKALILDPLIVSRDSFSPRTWARFQTGVTYSGGCLYIFLIYCFYHLTCLCNNFCGLSALVGCWSSAFIRRIIYKFLKCCPFDYTAFAVSLKVGIPLTGVTTLVGWLASRSAIVV